MKALYSPYILKRKSSGGEHQSVEGALFKFKLKEKDLYSLYHPISSLGDRSVGEIIRKFKDKSALDPTCKRIIGSAELLDEYFKKDSSLNLSLNCYFSLGDISNFKEKTLVKAKESNFDIIKVKLSDTKNINVDLIKDLDLKLILDYNSKGDVSNLDSFCSLNHGLIKYVEDPPKGFANNFNISIASDFDKNLKNPQFIINKPTGFEHQEQEALGDIKQGVGFITTSYLDHPLGQLIAAVSVKNKYSKLNHGLMTHKFYEENAYADLLSNKSKFNVNLDLSNNFKELLEKEEWREI